MAEYSDLLEDRIRKLYGQPPLQDWQRREAEDRNEKFRRDIDEMQRKQRIAENSLRNFILD